MDVQSGFVLGPLQQKIQAHHHQQQEKSDSVHDSSPMDQAACCSTAARSPADCLRVSRDGTLLLPCNRLHPTVRRSTREIRISTCSCLLHYSLQSCHMQSTVLIPIKQFTNGNNPLREVQNSIYSHLHR